MKNIIVFFLLGILPLCQLTAQTGKTRLSSEQAALLCSEAEALFHEANEVSRHDQSQAFELCRKAAARYERVLLESDLQNSKIHYNLGNIYFRMQDIGRAILEYRRALQLDPNDGKLLRNLQFARASRQDQFKLPEQTRILKTLFFWHYDFSFYLRQLVFLSLFLLLWTCATACIWYRPLWLRTCLVFLIILSFSFGLSLSLTLYQLHSDKYGVILTREVIARKGDSDSYSPSFTDPLHAGTEFKLLQQRQGWAEIELPDKQTCWLPNQDFELL
jgi:tetratricopeptide (TPR) repeat protein